MNRISVIVPVYNVAKYLPECLDSILNQTYRELEILVIDDGSTDGSGAICDEYARKDERIRVFHKENGGAASARNLGLREATGEYLAFVDSDDALEPDAYAFMLAQIRKQDADVVQCGYRDWYADGEKDQLIWEQPALLQTQEYLKRYTMDWTCGLLWDKLYRRELFDGVFFEEGHIIDDEFFTYRGVLNARSVLCVPKIVYHYRRRRSSVMTALSTQKRIVLDKLDYLVKRRRNVLARFPALKQPFDYHYLSMLVILAGEAAATEASILETKRQLKAYAEERTLCRMEFALLRKLLWLRFAGVDRILDQRKTAQAEKEPYEYFK